MHWDDPSPTIYIRRVDVPVDVETINIVLEMSEVSNAEFDDRLRGMDLRWEFHNQVY